MFLEADVCIKTILEILRFHINLEKEELNSEVFLMSLFLVIGNEPLKDHVMAIPVHNLFYVWNCTCKVISMLFAKSALRAEAICSSFT